MSDHQLSVRCQSQIPGPWSRFEAGVPVYKTGVLAAQLRRWLSKRFLSNQHREKTEKYYLRCLQLLRDKIGGVFTDNKDISLRCLSCLFHLRISTFICFRWYTNVPIKLYRIRQCINGMKLIKTLFCVIYFFQWMNSA